eukprot:CAMPEP_0176502028 /NCGR_PEP_ID=MMETSP0200_2-20121128/14518_1 /TAXON_ID=947934 /ORGANISM="Chaetoceros sp., Strain GSL56" /LENGTH=533 /DNA_ID=CAMNT_0017901039 /DNA_START=66 /DNA_END=1667 /DNA_ORIENTATION=+
MAVSTAVFRSLCHHASSAGQQQLCYSSSIIRRHFSSCLDNTTIQNVHHHGRYYNQTKIPPSRRIYTNGTSRSFSSVNESSMVPSPTNEDIAIVVPIDFQVSSQISGEESQILQVNLKANQILRAESGAMLFMTEGIEMSTSLGGVTSSTTTLGTGALIKDGFKRLLTGQNLFISDYSYKGEAGTEGTVALGTAFPSKIIRLSFDEYGGKIVCQKGAYLASSMGVNIEMEFAKKFSAGFFGGEGFVLQALTGEGDVFVKAGGALVKRELAEGETLRISSGSLVGFTRDVQFDVQMMPGFKNVMFGGEGLFVTTLTGPGIVWLQGMSPDKMISEIARRMPSGGGIGLGIPIGMGAGGGSGDDSATQGGADVVGTSSDEVGPEGIAASTAATDAAQAADRNATIVSSGYDGTSVDSESASSLFGDAAPKEAPSYGSNSSGSGRSSVDDDSSSLPDMDEPTTSSFSSQETEFSDDLFNDQQQQQLGDFQEDETSFSTGVEDESSNNNLADSGGNASDDGGGLFGMIWDFLTKDDDDE